MRCDMLPRTQTLTCESFDLLRKTATVTSTIQTMRNHNCFALGSLKLCSKLTSFLVLFRIVQYMLLRTGPNSAPSITADLIDVNTSNGYPSRSIGSMVRNE